MTAAENIVLPDAGSRGASPTSTGWRRSWRPSVSPSRPPARGALRRSATTVAAARALASRPEIVFADEPTGALDLRSGAELLAFLRTAVDELGQTVVMVTHDAVAASYADRVIFLADGHIVDEMHAAEADDILDYMKHLGA